MMKEKTTIRNCKFSFRCKANWDDLLPTDDQGLVRFCLECQREVYFCESDDELVYNVVNNRCIAIIREEHGRMHQLLGDVAFKE